MIITPTVPLTQSDNAGGNFFSSLISQLADNEITLIVPESGKGSENASFPSIESVIVIPEQPLSETPFVRGAQERFDRLAPLRPPRGFLRGLQADPRAHAALRDADLVDIEWPSLSWSIRGIAALAPSARVVTTLHDVPSQGFWREYHTAASIKKKILLMSGALQAKMLERRVLGRADSVVVFSEKDRGLLDAARNVDVLLPWIPGFEPDETADSSRAPVALFVGPLRRIENWDAAVWLCSEIWPAVRRRLPEARLRFIGSSTPSRRELLEETSGVDAVGFADDLGAEYRNATVAVMPLRLGAGLKFKVLEAMTSGLPFVATSTATEGIGDHEFAPASFDDPQRFADEVVRILTSASAERETALDRLRWAHSRYGELPFERAVTAIYGEPSETAPATREHYDVSVVVPVFNGEHLLSHQLAALARQAEAKDLDIVIADNGSSDRTKQVALAYGDAFGALRVIDAGDRRGVNHARNVGLAAAWGEKVLICDHDDEVHSGWVAALAQALETADVVGGHAVPYSPSLSGRRHAPTTNLGDPLHSVLGYLPYAIGASLGVRRAAALAVGGFDETFIGGHDEADFCWRLQEAGYSIRGEEKAILSYRQRARARDAYRQARNSARTRLLLWVRFARTGAPVAPVSFRGAIHQALLAVTDVARLVRPGTRVEAAKGIGWALGTLEGHWRYRLRKQVPDRMLMSSLERDESSPSSSEPRTEPSSLQNSRSAR
ncbi:glycosyltransferase [Microbacterium sp. USTB-Y]|uniref:glycosyltransferase n=1 Tax=Microbacterium sp. USTB-Y TaxID=2823692 RepID=UPI002040A297|nr:glycosyltransferase [Microbacterium sp. USTB-Y]